MAFFCAFTILISLQGFCLDCLLHWMLLLLIKVPSLPCRVLPNANAAHEEDRVRLWFDVRLIGRIRKKRAADPIFPTPFCPLQFSFLVFLVWRGQEVWFVLHLTSADSSDHPPGWLFPLPKKPRSKDKTKAASPQHALPFTLSQPWKPALKNYFLFRFHKQAAWLDICKSKRLYIHRAGFLLKGLLVSYSGSHIYDLLVFNFGGRNGTRNFQWRVAASRQKAHHSSRLNLVRYDNGLTDSATSNIHSG